MKIFIHVKTFAVEGDSKQFKIDILGTYLKHAKKKKWRKQQSKENHSSY